MQKMSPNPATRRRRRAQDGSGLACDACASRGGCRRKDKQGARSVAAQAFPRNARVRRGVILGCAAAAMLPVERCFKSERPSGEPADDAATCFSATFSGKVVGKSFKRGAPAPRLRAGIFRRRSGELRANAALRPFNAPPPDRWPATFAGWDERRAQVCRGEVESAQARASSSSVDALKCPSATSRCTAATPSQGGVDLRPSYRAAPRPLTAAERARKLVASPNLFVVCASGALPATRPSVARRPESGPPTLKRTTRTNRSDVCLFSCTRCSSAEASVRDPRMASTEVFAARPTQSPPPQAQHASAADKPPKPA